MGRAFVGTISANAQKVAEELALEMLKDEEFRRELRQWAHEIAVAWRKAGERERRARDRRRFGTKRRRSRKEGRGAPLR